MCYSPYLPNVMNGKLGRSNLIKRYCELRLSYKEVLLFLLRFYGIRLSLRHSKRLVKNLGIKRKRYASDLRDVIFAMKSWVKVVTWKDTDKWHKVCKLITSLLLEEKEYESYLKGVSRKGLRWNQNIGWKEDDMSTQVLITYSLWTNMMYRWVQQTYYVAGGVLDTQRPRRCG